MHMMSYLLLLFLGIVHADECYSRIRIAMCASYGKVPTLCRAGARASCTLTRNRTFCPTCVPISQAPAFCGRLNSISECASGVAPTAQANFTSGEICPSCTPPYVPPTCNEAKLRECHTKLQDSGRRPPQCAGGEAPQRDSTGCCLTCTPIASACTENDFMRCRAAYATTKACQAGENSKIGGNCCRTCKPSLDIPTRRTADSCSLPEMKRALKMVPVCEEGEGRITARTSTSCAPSCKRPESDFDMEDVFECVKSLKPCAENSKPVRLPGTRCPVCHPRPPVCDACPAARLCGRVPVSNMNRTLVKRCLRKHVFQLKLEAKKDFLKGYKKEEMGRVLIEFAERYCERNSAADKCDKYLDRLRDSIKCTRLMKIGMRTTVTVEVAEDESEDTTTETETSGMRRRLLQTENGASDLLVEATQDDTDLIKSSTVIENNVSKNMVSHALIILLASLSMLIWN